MNEGEEEERGDGDITNGKIKKMSRKKRKKGGSEKNIYTRKERKIKQKKHV